MYNDIDVVTCFLAGMAIGAAIVGVIGCSDVSKLFKRDKKKKTHETVNQLHIRIIRDNNDN